MNNKLVRVITGIIILIFIIISILPEYLNDVKSETKLINELTDEIKIEAAKDYLKNQTLYLYEGATYCVSAKQLEYKSDFIVEALYTNGEFVYSINNNCKEK